MTRGRPGVRNAILSRRITVLPDPYRPDGERYAERNRTTNTKLSPTMTRVDIGEPVKVDPYK